MIKKTMPIESPEVGREWCEENGYSYLGTVRNDEHGYVMTYGVPGVSNTYPSEFYEHDGRVKGKQEKFKVIPIDIQQSFATNTNKIIEKVQQVIANSNIKVQPDIHKPATEKVQAALDKKAQPDIHKPAAEKVQAVSDKKVYRVARVNIENQVLYYNEKNKEKKWVDCKNSSLFTKVQAQQMAMYWAKNYLNFAFFVCDKEGNRVY